MHWRLEEIKQKKVEIKKCGLQKPAFLYLSALSLLFTDR